MKKSSTARKPWLVKSILITLILFCISYYFVLPPLNLHSTELIRFLIGWLLIYILIALLCAARASEEPEGEEEATPAAAKLGSYFSFAKANCKPVLAVICLLLVVFLFGQLLSLPLFRANAYHTLLTVDEGDFSQDIQQLPYSVVPMLDGSAAQRLGDRKLGELSDMVSQFAVSETYTQINVDGSPVRVACLEYGDIFKWFLNRQEGLPAYVKVDMVTQEVEIVRLSSLDLDGIRYSPSEYLTRDLERTLRFRYPTYLFSDPHLEIDESGTPWWVCPRETRTIGLYGGTDIVGTVLLNACTGESQYYDVQDVPTWVDQVYQAELIAEQYNYYGKYCNGFFNSLIGQKDVTVTTSGANYLTMEDDIYMYTGVTSISSDQSNIGFLLSNQRTKQTVYYAAPGAIETSAQHSAEGVVQDLGYTATFPLLLNIGGQPTYFMSLKDSADLVKQYAMVNVSQYQLVATGDTAEACEASYLTLLNREGTETTALDQSVPGGSAVTVSGTIAEIRTAVLEGTTYYFLRLEGDETFYACPATQDRRVILLNVGQAISLQVTSPSADDPIGEVLTLQ